jgi:hypothetical protein
MIDLFWLTVLISSPLLIATAIIRFVRYYWRPVRPPRYRIKTNGLKYKIECLMWEYQWIELSASYTTLEEAEQAVHAIRVVDKLRIQPWNIVREFNENKS